MARTRLVESKRLVFFREALRRLVSKRQGGRIDPPLPGRVMENGLPGRGLSKWKKIHIIQLCGLMVLLSKWFYLVTPSARQHLMTRHLPDSCMCIYDATSTNYLATPRPERPSEGQEMSLLVSRQHAETSRRSTTIAVESRANSGCPGKSTTYQCK